jgi:hypothetical protein
MNHIIKKLLLAGVFIIAVQLAYSQKIPTNKWPLKVLLPKLDTAKKDSVAKPVPRVDAKPYSKVITKDFTTKKGLFTVHQSKAIVYFEISDSILRRDIMLISRLTKGPGGYGAYPGEELDEKTIEFEKGADSTIRIRLKLVVNEADSSNAIYKAVVQSSVDPIAVSFPIISYGPNKKSYVIDATKFLKERSMVNNIDGNASISKGVTTASMKDFYIESIHAYPENVEFSISKSMDSKLNALSPTPVTIVSHTSFIALPKIPMQRRYFDPRVGYFADSYYAYGDKQQKTELRKFIVRWRLEPRAQDVVRWKRGELVEPKKPIIIYIDPATPKQWRPYLIAGINDWQKAFEKAGFKNAIIGKEWPENDTTMHMDDARYSILNYFPSEVANAYGPQIHDPRSGEIIQTHIGWYHNVMSLLHDWYMVQTAAVDPKARTPKFNEELMGQLIRFVSSHEVGHTLGLRHNFGSSSQTPVDSLRSNTYLNAHGHTASIMDYARFNYVAQPEDHISQQNLFPRIGEYDDWAIEWGYKDSRAANADEDKKVMDSWILQRLAKNKRLWFGDGESSKFDPRCQTEDIGDNAMKASAYGIKNLQRILLKLPEWTKGEGGVNDNLLQMYKTLQGQYFRYMGHVLKNVSGVSYNVKDENEKGAAYYPVPVQKQQQALEFFNEQLFKTPYWLMNKTVMGRVSQPSDPDFVSDTQVRVLNSLLDLERITRMQALFNQFGTKAIPVNVYIATIHRGIWQELRSPGIVKVDGYRRNLQKAYFGCILTILASKDPANTENDAFSILKADLFLLQKELKSAESRAKDPLTIYHLKDLESRIQELMHPRIS